MFKARFVLVLGLAFLCMGGIRKNEDPVRVTEAQTAAISYKQKAEEDKDGRKGAPSPSMTFYANNEFMTTPAVKDQKAGDMEPETAPAPEEAADAGFEELEDGPGQEKAGKAVEEEDSWWSENDEETFSQDTPSEKG